MPRSSLLLSALLFLAAVAAPLSAATPAASSHRDEAHPEAPQDTGFLNRTVTVHGVQYRFQVYLPAEWRRDDRRLWPVILFLHGRGERGSEGMWQTQIGLPQAVRDHPERWPFVIVMPQCPLTSVWTDTESLDMALAALDQESAEFHGDPDRTYLSGLSLGGYGAWELVRRQPRRWAAVAIAASGIFWSYAPERWLLAATLPAEYVRPLGKTAVWLFHGADDNVVAPKQSELMYEALKASGGRVRFWLYQGLKHDCWTRAYLEPDLPRWLLSHHIEPHLETRAGHRASHPEGRVEPYAERTIVPLHPPALRLTQAQLDALSGEYFDARGHVVATLYHQGEQLYERTPQGDTNELAAESLTQLFYPNGSSLTRVQIERDPAGRITALQFRDDRHEERWERKPGAR